MKTTNYINGKWISTNNKLPVLNPVNLELVAEVDVAGVSEVESAINSADTAFATWKLCSKVQRSEYLLKIYHNILKKQSEAAKILSLENGKSYAEANAEIAYGAEYFKAYAEYLLQQNHREHLLTTETTRIELVQEPAGVCALITPWNFPQAMLARKMAAAIAAGCCVVAKPDEQTPLSAIFLMDICDQVDLPAGVVNLVVGDPEEIGNCLMKSPKVKKLSFTGSTEVGKLLIQQSASTVKKLTLELGGNAPFIVFEDADIESAVQGAMQSKFRNSGQTCVCTNRFLIHKDIFAEFKKNLLSHMEKLKIGDTSNEAINIGPLINKHAKEKVERLLVSASKVGAKIDICGSVPNLAGNFVCPTVVEMNSIDSEIFKTEIFGPIAVLYKFSTEEEAIEIANSTEYGLASYFYTQDIERIKRLEKQLEFGMIGVNSGRVSNSYAPFGGVKHSGYGKEGGMMGLEEFQITKTIYKSL